MNVGLDLDDTITEMPWLFSAISIGLREDGHKVYVLSYRDECERADTADELTQLNIFYKELYLAPKNIAASVWKATIAEKLKLDVLFDDSPEDLDALPPEIQRVWLCNPDVFDLGVCLRALKERKVNVISL